MIDALRALAIVGVVLGHWLVSVVVFDQNGPHIASPLQHLPELTPLTWVLQLLGLFFFAGGWANVRSLDRASGGSASATTRGSILGRGYLPWLGARLDRMLRPVVLLAGFVAVLLAVLGLSGWTGADLYTVGLFVVSPLWFLPVYLVLTAGTPIVDAAVRRWGAWAAVGPAAVVLLLDLLRYGPWWELPASVGTPNLIAAWLVPYVLGVAFARGRLVQAAGPWLFVAGLAACVALIVFADYPASMTGVTGADRSNMGPPSLLVPAMALAQLGVALTFYRRLARALTRPWLWAIVVTINLVAMTVYLWHQTALMSTQLATHAVGLSLLGFDGVPADLTWLLSRLALLPLCGVVLCGFILLFRRWEQRSASTVLRPAAPAGATADAARPTAADQDPPRHTSPAG